MCGPQGSSEQVVQGPDHQLAGPLFPPALAQPLPDHFLSCSFLDDPQSSSYLTLLPNLPLDPLVSRLPVPMGKGLFLTLQMPNSMKDKK